MSDSTMTNGSLAPIPCPAGIGVTALSTRAWLTLIIAVSVVARVAAALPRSTPRFFPDEYIYGALGRSIADGHLGIRGGPAHFPALLEPILAAPIWLAGDTGLSYRLLQGYHAAAMSFAVIPAFALARYLGIETRRALLAAAATVSVPALVYSSYATADAIAYPLVVCAVLLAVRALDRPSAGRQAAFLGVACAASFARLQFVVLFASFVAAAVVVSGGRPREIVRSAGIVISAATIALLAVIATGAASLGVYGGLLSSRIEPLDLAHWLGTDTIFLAFASGVALVPTAAVGIAYGLHTSRHRAERGFAAFTIVFGASVLFESALIVTNETGRFYERYLIGLFPLVPIAFCLGVNRLPRGRAVAGAVTVVLLIAAMLLPLSEFTVAFGAQDSPFLQAVSALEHRIGFAEGSLVVAATVSFLAIAAAIASWRQRWTDTLLVGTVLVTCVASIGTVSWDRARSHYVRSELMGTDPRWIDDARSGPATLLVLPGDPSTPMFDLFWNKSLTRVALLPGAHAIDSFATARVSLDQHGTLLIGGSPIRTSFAIGERWGTVQLSGARRRASSGRTTLWVPQGRPAIRLLTLGRYQDGWLADAATLWAYPSASAQRGRILIPVSLPRGYPETTLKVSVQGTSQQSIRVRPGLRQVVDIPVGFTGRRIVIELRGENVRSVGGRMVSVRAGVPRLEPAFTRPPNTR